MRALVVEDSKTQALHLRSLLAAAGYEVEVAYDAEKALAAVAARRPDVVISDIVMPGKDGYTLCRELKASPATASLPVILVTSLGEPLDVARALEAGADNFVTKPYDDAQLVARVRRTLEPSSGGGELHLGGQRFPVRAAPEQTLRVLSSALEDAAVRNRELEHTRARLERANAERETMLNAVAHELRNPLNALTLAARLAAQGGAAGESMRRELPERVGRYVRQMVTLVDDLHDLARIDMGTLRVDREEGDLARLAREVADKLRGTSTRHTLEVDAPETAPLSLDADRIEQVVTNFVTNAIKYSPRGGVVRIRVEVCDEHARLSVQDDGVGIPAAALPQLFGRYYRVPGSEKVAKGLGLGLHIARTLVELHGGRVGVESTEGVGSTFWLELPRGESLSYTA